MIYDRKFLGNTLVCLDHLIRLEMGDASQVMVYEVFLEQTFGDLIPGHLSF